MSSKAPGAARDPGDTKGRKWEEQGLRGVYWVSGRTTGPVCSHRSPGLSPHCLSHLFQKHRGLGSRIRASQVESD